MTKLDSTHNKKIKVEKGKCVMSTYPIKLKKNREGKMRYVYISHVTEQKEKRKNALSLLF